MEDEVSDKDTPSSASSSPSSSSAAAAAAAVTGAGSDDEGRNEERRLSGAGGRRPSLPVPLRFPFGSAFSSGNPFMTGARSNPFASPEEMGEDGEEIENEEEEEMGDVNVLQTRASRLDWFPPELIPQLPESPIACTLFEAAEGHISSLKSIISSHKVQARQHEREIENIIEETITSTSRYESQFQSLRRQHDDLMLQMVKLNTELEAYKSGERVAQRQGMGDGNEESSNSQPFYLNHAPSSSSSLSSFPSTPIPSSSPPFSSSSSSSSSAASTTDAGLSSSEPDDVFGRITKLMIELERKMALSSDQSSVRKRLPLLIEFLTHLHNDKSRERQTIDKQITQLDRDLKALKEYQDSLPKEIDGHSSSSSSSASGEAMSTSNGDKSPTRRRSPKASSRIRAEIALEGSLSDPDSVLKRRGRDDDDEPVESRQRKKQKVMAHFNELRDIYFNQMPSQDQKRIDEFCSELEKASQYDDLKALRTFNYRSFSANPRTSNHVCKIEIDQNQNFLSVAGSLNLIQIFDYKSQICPDTASSSSMFPGDVEDPISPVQQLHYDSDHHLTSTAWATNVNGKIVSTDVQGRVHLWNVETGDLERSFEGHDGTGYQVKCNRNSAIGLFGSASADKTVRLWDPSTNRPPIKIVESSECLSLAFDPLNEFLLYVACADSRIVFYDYRNIRSSLFTLTGHSNIVHNVQFDHSNNLFSMSNDSTVQMWSPSSNFGQYQIDGAPLSFSQYESRRTFKGHKNPKYAAAMATSRDLLACGSEDNNLVIYSKSSSYPILNHSFNTGLFTQDYNQYITDICWDHSELNLVGANSKGIIKVFQLTKIADDDDDDDNDSASNDSKME